MWKVLLITNLQPTTGSNQVDNNKMVAHHMVHWKHGCTVYGQLSNLLLLKAAFQWTWYFHTTLDVEDNTTHYLQHIFIVFHFYVERNSLIKILEEIYFRFNKIWDEPMVAKFKCWSWGI